MYYPDSDLVAGSKKFKSYQFQYKIMDENNDRAILIKGELFQNVEQYTVARKIFDKWCNITNYLLHN